jgi:hypothetical protein
MKRLVTALLFLTATPTPSPFPSHSADAVIAALHHTVLTHVARRSTRFPVVCVGLESASGPVDPPSSFFPVSRPSGDSSLPEFVPFSQCTEQGRVRPVVVHPNGHFEPTILIHTSSRRPALAVVLSPPTISSPTRATVVASTFFARMTTETNRLSLTASNGRWRVVKSTLQFME